jgi:hypothetical protein
MDKQVRQRNPAIDLDQPADLRAGPSSRAQPVAWNDGADECLAFEQRLREAPGFGHSQVCVSSPSPFRRFAG